MRVVSPTDPLRVDSDGNLQVYVAGGGEQAEISIIPIASTVATIPAQIVVGATAVQVLALNLNRKKCLLQNAGTTIIWIGLGANPAQTAYHVSLPAGGSQNDGSSPVWQDTMWQGAVYAVSSAPGGLLIATELT